MVTDYALGGWLISQSKHLSISLYTWPQIIPWGGDQSINQSKHLSIRLYTWPQTIPWGGDQSINQSKHLSISLYTWTQIMPWGVINQSITQSKHLSISLYTWTQIMPWEGNQSISQNTYQSVCIPDRRLCRVGGALQSGAADRLIWNSAWGRGTRTGGQADGSADSCFLVFSRQH